MSDDLKQDDLLERLDNMGHEIPPPELIPLAKRCAARIRELEDQLKAARLIGKAHFTSLEAERKARDRLSKNGKTKLALIEEIEREEQRAEAAEAKLADEVQDRKHYEQQAYAAYEAASAAEAKYAELVRLARAYIDHEDSRHDECEICDAIKTALKEPK